MPVKDLTDKEVRQIYSYLDKEIVLNFIAADGQYRIERTE